MFVCQYPLLPDPLAFTMRFSASLAVLLCINQLAEFSYDCFSFSFSLSISLNAPCSHSIAMHRICRELTKTRWKTFQRCVSKVSPSVSVYCQSFSLRLLPCQYQHLNLSVSLLHAAGDGDLRSLRQENDTIAQSFKRNQDEYGSLMTSAEQAAVTAADRIAQLEEKARLARSEHSSVVIESQTLVSKVHSIAAHCVSTLFDSSATRNK